MTQSATAEQPLRVILVDDDSDDHEFLLSAIKRADVPIHVTKLGSGAELLHYLRGQRDPHTPEVVLLDLNMPVMNGLETLQAVRQDPAICEQVINLFSASTNRDDVQRAYDMGANSYITKPAKYAEWLHVVRNLYLFWRTVTALPSIK